jgi:hypothetical protein
MGEIKVGAEGATQEMIETIGMMMTGTPIEQIQRGAGQNV